MLYITKRKFSLVAKWFMIFYFILTVVIFFLFALTDDGKTVRLPKYTSDYPVIYVITPTYKRLVQKAELIRIIHTFLHIKNLHWIVVEDAPARTELVSKILRKSGLTYTHLFVATPEPMKLQQTEARWRKPRGLLQRNEGLSWLRDNLSGIGDDVVYFADDDNTYDLALFDEMRFTKKVSVWPVGLVGYLRYESPVVKEGKVVSWITAWKPGRTFATDMAGFAVSTSLLMKSSNAGFNINSKVGEQENDFLLALGVQMADLEPKARNCTEILVWHTQTVQPSLKNEGKVMELSINGYDFNTEDKKFNFIAFKNIILE